MASKVKPINVMGENRYHAFCHDCCISSVITKSLRAAERFANFHNIVKHPEEIKAVNTHVSLHPDLIGEILTIQILKRDGSDGDLVDPSTLIKHVGTLEGYFLNSKYTTFWMTGGNKVSFRNSLFSYEVYQK